MLLLEKELVEFLLKKELVDFDNMNNYKAHSII